MNTIEGESILIVCTGETVYFLDIEIVHHTARCLSIHLISKTKIPAVLEYIVPHVVLGCQAYCLLF